MKTPWSLAAASMISLVIVGACGKTNSEIAAGKVSGADLLGKTESSGGGAGACKRDDDEDDDDAKDGADQVGEHEDDDDDDDDKDDDDKDDIGDKEGVCDAADADDDDEDGDDDALDEATKAILATASVKLSGNETAAERQALAKVTMEEAKATALAKVPGEVKDADLDNEGGFLVYSIDIIKDGKSNDVKIDAGNGKFLYIDTDGDEGPEGKE